MGREVVMRFLKDKDNMRFTTSQFVDYMLERGYSLQTAYSWLTRLRKEGYIKREVRNRRTSIWRNLMLERKDMLGDSK